MNATTHDLLRSAGNGDHDALGQLLDTHRNYLRLLAELQLDARLRAKCDASDVVQDAFAAAQKNFANFRGHTTVEFQAWLRQILSHSLMMAHRRFFSTKQRDIRLERNLVSELENSSHGMASLAASQTSPSQQASDDEQLLLLSDALSQLPEDLRRVIVLHDLEGLSLRDVADQLQRSYGTVRRMWARGLAALRDAMSGETS